MKAFGRFLLKFFLLILVIAVAAGGAIAWRTYQRSEPGYIMDQYLSHLIDGNTEEAFRLLDQSEEALIDMEEYAQALGGKQYGLNASYTSSEMEKRADNNGNEYVDFHVAFKDAEEDVQHEEDFTVKKQQKAAFGIFDQWKVLSGHCMVKNLAITVPTGSEVYLDNQPLDTMWIARDGVPYSLDCYRIPSLLPGRKSLVIRHPAFESMNTTLDTNEGDQDYSALMAIRKPAQNACMELGISALKQLYAAAVKEDAAGLELFGACKEQAEQFVKQQGDALHEDQHAFQSAAISRFAPEYAAPVFSEGEDGAITMEMTLGYHYLLQEDVTAAAEEPQEGEEADVQEEQEDVMGTQGTSRESYSGDVKAVFVMSFREGSWSIASVNVPLLAND